MLIPPLGLVDAIESGLRANESDVGPPREAVNLAMRLLRTWIARRGIIPRDWYENLSEALSATGRSCPSGAPSDKLLQLATEIDQEGTAVRPGHDVDGHWRALLGRVELGTCAVANDEALPVAARDDLVRRLLRYEEEQLTSQVAAPAVALGVSASTLTQDRIQSYLRDRLAEPDLVVEAFEPLPGGFGKDTYFLSVAGHQLPGEYVIRRDQSSPLIHHDCHAVRVEFQVMRAMYARGFPVPEALWCDTHHSLLPGPDFILMRRSRGRNVGDLFGATQAVPAPLSQTLARILARLHSQPPLRELGTLTNSIRPELWDCSLTKCVQQYIEGWREMFFNGAHFPSPAVAALFGWMLKNIPDLEGSPVLLHGDIGFHNILMDGEHIAAVLDWEYAHIGDPAEDLAYVRNTVGKQLDWAQFMHSYAGAGGPSISANRLRFFQVWGQLRNLCAANMVATLFAQGGLTDPKMLSLPYRMMPVFLREAEDLLAQHATERSSSNRQRRR